MARFAFFGFLRTSLRSSTPQKFLIAAAWVLGCALVPTTALAQRPVAHPGVGGRPGGGVRTGAPVIPTLRPPGMSVPRASGARGAAPNGAGPHFGGVGARGFGFGQPRIHIFRQRQFFGRPFFRFGLGLGFNSFWWPTCGPSIGWAGFGGFDCSPLPYYGYAFQNYIAPVTYGTAEYFYGGGDRDVVWLFQKDGKAYGVTDYWFVNEQVHFRMVEDDPTKVAEHVIPRDELDVQKTVYVNTHRGFRMVVRDEPWQQYLRDHPDLTPPELKSAQKNE